MWLLFALALVTQSVLGAVGELHESTAHAGAAAHYATHAHGGANPAADDVDDADDPLHALSHHVHCCGHVSAIVPPSATLPLHPGAAGPGRCDDGDSPASVPDGPFRPPIA